MFLFKFCWFIISSFIKLTVLCLAGVGLLAFGSEAVEPLNREAVAEVAVDLGNEAKVQLVRAWDELKHYRIVIVREQS